MRAVLEFPQPARTLSPSERASQLATWQHALDAPAAHRADLCIVCLTATAAHFDEHGRYRGCAVATRQERA